jgi:hypothetical protein
MEKKSLKQIKPELLKKLKSLTVRRKNGLYLFD